MGWGERNREIRSGAYPGGEIELRFVLANRRKDKADKERWHNSVVKRAADRRKGTIKEDNNLFKGWFLHKVASSPS